MKKILVVLMISALLSCSKQTQNNNETTNSEVSAEQQPNTPAGSNTNGDETSTDVISNNQSADNPNAANAEPKFKFNEESWDFGTITEGEQVSHTFKFTNAGNADLVISSASASCGCTVPKHSKEPIPPGKTGEIAVTFNSAGKGSGVPITKDVTVIANTNPVQTILHITAVVMPEKK